MIPGMLRSIKTNHFPIRTVTLVVLVKVNLSLQPTLATHDQHILHSQIVPTTLSVARSDQNMLQQLIPTTRMTLR